MIGKTLAACLREKEVIGSDDVIVARCVLPVRMEGEVREDSDGALMNDMPLLHDVENRSDKRMRKQHDVEIPAVDAFRKVIGHSQIHNLIRQMLGIGTPLLSKPVPELISGFRLLRNKQIPLRNNLSQFRRNILKRIKNRTIRPQTLSFLFHGTRRRVMPFACGNGQNQKIHM